MEVKFLLLAALTFALNFCTSSTEEEVIDCMDSAYCSLIKGDIAKESAKYNHYPKKFYAEAVEFHVKATDYNKTKDDSVAKGCQSFYKTCFDEAATMAVDGLGFPTVYQNILRAALPDKRLSCRHECIMDMAEDFTFSNGKALVRIPSGESMKMTGLPLDLETRIRNENRPGIIWQFEGLADKDGVIIYRDDKEVCPPDSWVDTVSNFINSTISGMCPRLHVDFVCRSPSDLGTKNNQGHILGAIATYANYVSDVNKTTRTVITNTSGPAGYTCRYVDITSYENCNGIPRTTQHTYLTGVSVTTQSFDSSTPGVFRVNYLCGDSKDWRTNNGRVDSILRVCPPKTAICGIRTQIARLKTLKSSNGNIRDVTIGCCDVNERYINTAIRSVIPKTPTPAPPSVATEGENRLLTLQRNFLLFWAGVLSNHITRYNYFYSPHTIDKETDWQTTKCADGTFVNVFEVTNPISVYHWTRRIMVLKFKCGAVDGSKSADLDLYTKLNTGKYSLQDPDLNEKSDCGGGYYSTIELIYYLDKTRQKAALVNAWGITMKCTKGGNSESHTHTVNSTPRNVIAENTIQNGVVDCGIGKAICGFANKLAERRRGAFEGLYFKVICCTV